MKTDINKCSTCRPGEEKYKKITRDGKTFVQYEYRTPDGELFSVVKCNLETARICMGEWLSKEANQ